MKYRTISFTAILIIVSSLVIIAPTSSYGLTPPHKGIDYSQELAWQQEHLWNLGKNLSVGDSYTYKICDPDAIIHYSAESFHYFTKNLEHNGSMCYTAKLDFVNLVSTDENQIDGDIWIVQATIHDESTDNLRYSVFHVDADSYEVRSADTIHPDTIRYAKSLQNTIFSLHKYTAIQSKMLQPGVNWGEVTEYNDRGQNPYMSVLDEMKWDASSYHFGILNTKIVTEQREIDVFSVGYEIDIEDALEITQKENKKDKEEEKEEDKNNNNVTNSFFVASHLPFPVTGEYFNPSYIIEPHKEYEFELITYLETASNRPSTSPFSLIPLNNDVDVDDTSDLPITITGTIKLTLPDDDDVTPDDTVTNDAITPDDIEIIPNDDNDNHDSNDNDMDVIAEDNNNAIAEDYAKMGGLALLLIAMIAGYIMFKKLKDGKVNIKSIKKKTTGDHSSKNKTTVHFDEKLHIDIKTKTRGSA